MNFSYFRMLCLSTSLQNRNKFIGGEEGGLDGWFFVTNKGKNKEVNF